MFNKSPSAIACMTLFLSITIFSPSQPSTIFLRRGGYTVAFLEITKIVQLVKHFENHDLISELEKDIIYGDGTFDKAPNKSYQLFTWLAKICNSHHMYIFSFGKKNSYTYSGMFAMLQQLLTNVIIMPN